MNSRKIFGDYQTPESLAERICDYLRSSGVAPDVVIDPTCGIGNLLKSSLVFGAGKYYGVEINREYCDVCCSSVRSEKLAVLNEDFFSFDFRRLAVPCAETLILGNPPWVTNAEMSRLSANNLPPKTNAGKRRGIDAVTGQSNFDICEYMIVELARVFAHTNTTVAMLCKTSVARRVFLRLNEVDYGVERCDMLEFDSAATFHVSVPSCLLVFRLSANGRTTDCCTVGFLDDPQKVRNTYRCRGGRLCDADSTVSQFLDGTCEFEWRQGIKHDCADIVEFYEYRGRLVNGRKEAVEIENAVLFPLIKSSMIKKPLIDTFSKYVLVPQRTLREDPGRIARIAPKAWQYLLDHADAFARRRSVVYRNSPAFSMFGIGGYAFSAYKVAISGFYKNPLFSLLHSSSGKPVMLDDTCYFLSFDDYDDAYVAMLLLNAAQTRDFLSHIAFVDAKRPYTKKVLARLEFGKILKCVDYEALRQTEDLLRIDSYLSRRMLEDFAGRLPSHASPTTGGTASVSAATVRANCGRGQCSLPYI